MSQEPDRQYVDDVPREIQDLLYDGRKIEAIKLAYASSDLSLADAKDRIEQVEQDLRERNPEAFRAPPGGCGGSAALALLCMLLLVLAMACGGGDKAPSNEPAETAVPTIGYSFGGLNRAQEAIMGGLVQRAEQKGWQVLRANANFSATQQAEQIDYFIDRGVDAVVAVPIDSKGIGVSVKKCKAAGIPFYTIDRAPEGVEIEMAVLADNAMAGKQCGRAVLGLLRERHGEPRGTVVELQGNLHQNVARARSAGFHSVLDQHGGIEVIQRPTDWNPARVEEILSELLPAGHIDAIYMHSDAAALSVTLDVLQEYDRLVARGKPGHVLVVSVDGSPAMLQAIRDGRADFCASQPLTDFGIVVDWIEDNFAGRPVQGGVVERPGAPWSPAHVERSDIGWKLLLTTTAVTAQNVDDKSLWGNQ